jgi:hypothetical protein
MKKAEQNMTGGDDISEGVEMAGWGVEEAEKANKTEASMSSFLDNHFQIHRGCAKIVYMDTNETQAWEPNSHSHMLFTSPSYSSEYLSRQLFYLEW